MDKKKVIKEIRSWVLLILGAFVLSFIINSEVLAKVTVEESSMENTLFENQQLLVDEISYRFHEPKQGDIIIFFKDEEKGNIIDSFNRYIDSIKQIITKEESHIRYVKRVIGVTGDTIDIRDGFVYVNDIKLKEPYANGITESREFTLPYTVGEEELFVLGDHRDVSMDSRSFGPISKKQVDGKVILRVFPFDQFGTID